RIGSNTNLIAPVRVGAGAFTGAGSSIYLDVPDDALALERTEQKNIEGWAIRRRQKAEAAKAAKASDAEPERWPAEPHEGNKHRRLSARCESARGCTRRSRSSPARLTPSWRRKFASIWRFPWATRSSGAFGTARSTSGSEKRSGAPKCSSSSRHATRPIQT